MSRHVDPLHDIWHALDQYYKVAPRTAARAQYALEKLVAERDQLRANARSIRLQQDDSEVKSC